MSSKRNAPEPEVYPRADAPAPGGTELAVPVDMLPLTLHLLPVQQHPFFPIQNLPVVLSEDPWLETISAVGETPQHAVGLVLVAPDATDPPHAESFAEVGTVVRIHQPMRSEGHVQFIAEGRQRFRIVEWISREPPYMARVEYLGEEREPYDEQVKAYAMAIIATIKELIPLNPLYNEELKGFLSRFTPNQPAFLGYFGATLTTASAPELQQVLEAPKLLSRLRLVIGLLKKELDIAKLQTEIRHQVEEKISHQQREFFLREQLKAIQEELGIAKDDRTAEGERFRERLAALKLSEEAKQRVDEELEKFSVLQSGSPEYAVTRNYLDWMTSLPWGMYSRDKLNLKHARAVLDRDHTGLDDVKDRIIEFLAVGKLRGEVSGSILLLVGPPGVGKTSIGRSVADALGRKLFRFSVGGMRDEAEIKGHRRTYIGAMPGKFIQALKDVQVANPLIMLDEVDKIGASYQGDPASALLEVLDPEQNEAFLDHYLDVRFDLSRVLFICTANQLDTVPAPLLDRMETIRLSGYIAREKVAIATRHLWPRQLERAGVARSRLKISDAALRRLVDGYARAAGVRDVDKQLGRIVRKAAVQIASGEHRAIRVTGRNLDDFLGPALFRPEKPLSGVGISTGLAWTSLGGVTLAVEATLVHKKQRGFKLTGKLGEVMRESAEIAYSYIASHLSKYDAAGDFFDQAFIHLHVPEGATPKDGPSAGITMATALLSLARGKRPRANLAMTGELTLTGEVLPVGGIREKVIAARRARIARLVLPEDNRRDVDELPDYLREGLEVHYARRYAEVSSLVFGR